MKTQFKLIRETDVSELNGTVKEYRHEPTGAEYISVENDDNNKVFGITFRTPPADSTGVAHILEHTVLCGSRKYPLKDPFVQLLKSSQQTFLNAMTYPDKTVYPVASQNVQDFYNLVDVYLDAAFFPRITPAFFRQEGWHYELDNPDAPLTCKGVVYNEMKGAYSSPDSLLLERSQQSLFPDTTYGLDSGGNPAVIPTLTYGDFREFHEMWYHPSNARIFFYGNDDPAKRLEILEEYLSGFQSLENPPDSSIPLQPAFKNPALVKETYAAGDENAKAYVTLNWAMPEGSQHFALTVLDHILTGTSGSPLRKALIESGLGEDIAGFGLETHMRQPVYSIGMKGVDAPNLGTVEQLIVQTLEEIAEAGLDRGDIDAALNSFEFDLRENNRGSCPQGLSVLLTMLETWLYDWDPLVLVGYEKPLNGLKQALSDNPRFFEELIENSLLKNPHRSVVHLIPDSFKAEREEAEDAATLKAVKGAMIPDEIKRTLTATDRLLDMQKAPDSPAAVKTIPLLKRSDLRRDIRTIPREVVEFNNATVLYHNLFTRGIAYIDIGFNLHVLDTDDLPWISLLGSLLLETGTQKEDFASLSQRIARTTGGIYAAPVHAAPEGSPKSVSRLFLRGKCMVDRTGDLFDILHDILFLPAFDNRKRFKEVLLEQKAEMESGLVPNGHTAVLSRIKARTHEAFRAAEAMGGIDALFFHRDLENRIDTDWNNILNKLETIRCKLLGGGLVINITADDADRSAIFQTLEKFLNHFPDAENPTPTSTPPSAGEIPNGQKRDSKPWKFEADLPHSEALLAPSRVNYVGAGINLFDTGYEYDASALVITKYLRTAWLWEQIRVQGGAYGAVCTFDPNCGSFAFASYRDPNLATTLETYAQTGEFLKTVEIDDYELSRALIGAIGGIDTYRLPDAKGYTDTLRWLTGVTDEKRQRRRDQLLATTVDDFRRFGEVLNMHHAATAVLGSKEAIEQSGLPFEHSRKIL